MVSIEEKMIQKDKETAVLKANYKHQIMLNIELERIEKYRRTYENSHNFEVAVMNAQRKKILRRQSELRRMKVEMVKRAVDLKSGRGSRIESAQGKNCSVEILEMVKSDLAKIKPSMNKSDGTAWTNGGGANVSQLRTGYTQAKHNHNSTAKQMTESSFAFDRLHINGARETHDAAYMTMARAQTNDDETRAKSQTERCSVKFPGLKSPSTRPAHSTQLQHDPEANASQTHAVNSASGKVRTCYRNVTHRKSTHRSPVVDMSPFDVFRLKLKESEDRSYRCKLPLRSISAVEALRRDGMSEMAMLYRRSHSAVIQ